MVKVLKRNSLVLFLFTLLALCGGCQKEAINGDLDGKWQIMDVEKDGVVESVKDEQLYYNFYMHVCNLNFYGGDFTVGNLKYENNTIWLDFPYATTPESVARLQQYGIFTNPVTFSIEYLDKNKLILKNGDVVLTLRKF